jgi:hypothetical protein
MHTHPASCLRGPITRSRGHWLIGDVLTTDDNVPQLSDPDIRTDLVRRLRQEIADGTYETPEKWEKALDRLLKEIE